MVEGRINFTTWAASRSMMLLICFIFILGGADGGCVRPEADHCTMVDYKVFNSLDSAAADRQAKSVGDAQVQAWRNQHQIKGSKGRKKKKAGKLGICEDLIR